MEKLEGNHSQFARIFERRRRAPEHLERQLHHLTRRAGEAALSELTWRQHFAQVFGKTRYLRRMLRRQREGLDVEDESLGGVRSAQSFALRSAGSA